MKRAFETMHGYYIEELEFGMSVSVGKTFSDSDVAAYAQLSTDDNPLHLDEEFASQARTEGRVLHGLITASLISAIIGTRLPGPGCLWMRQEMRFLAPVRVGEHVEAVAEVVRVEQEKQRVYLKTVCKVSGTAVIDGQAMVWVPSRASPR